MRTCVKKLFIFFLASLLFGCSKNEDFEMQPIVDHESERSRHTRLKVYPSDADDILTKAEEDWQNINDALQYARRGQVIQLAEGLFYLHKSIVKWDFDGVLKGSGMNKTIIQTAPGQLFDVSECPPLDFSFKNTDGFFMFCFAYHYTQERRTVTISDLTIVVDEPSTPYYQYLPGESPQEGNSIQAVNVQYEKLDNDLANPIRLNVMFRNISVKGEEDEKYLNDGYSLYAGLAAFGASRGFFAAKNVNVENATYAIISNYFKGDNSLIMLRKCKTFNNKNGFLSLLAHSWIILNSDFEKSSASSIVLDKYNKMTDLEMPAGRSFIFHNKINVNGGVAMATYDIENTKVIDNVFYGSGYTGIYAHKVNDWKIINNDFCDVINPILGATIFLIQSTNFEIMKNSNQIVGGPSAGDPSNIIGQGRECDF